MLVHRKTTSKTNDTAIRRASYNSAVNSPIPAKAASDARHENASEGSHKHRHATYAAEASGLLLMAILLLILTVIRYWRDIPWSAR